MTATDDPARAARQHQRDVLNSIIDLLESLPDQQQRSETILSAAAIVGVKITEKTTTSPRGGYRPGPRNKRSGEACQREADRLAWPAMKIAANQDFDPAQLERIGEMLEAGKLDAALQVAGYDPQQFRSDLDTIAKVAARQEVPSHEIMRSVREMKALITDIETMLYDAFGPESAE